MERVEIRDPVEAEDNASPSITNFLVRFLSAASAIQG
jgi:hypothetical protein